MTNQLGFGHLRTSVHRGVFLKIDAVRAPGERQKKHVALVKAEPRVQFRPRETTQEEQQIINARPTLVTSAP